MLDESPCIMYIMLIYIYYVYKCNLRVGARQKESCGITFPFRLQCKQKWRNICLTLYINNTVWLLLNRIIISAPFLFIIIIRNWNLSLVGTCVYNRNPVITNAVIRYLTLDICLISIKKQKQIFYFKSYLGNCWYRYIFFWKYLDLQIQVGILRLGIFICTF